MLVEDTAEGNGLHAEHGVSFWIEYGESKLLFDTGQTGVVVKNAEILGIDLAQADAIVISHGHNDHTGGLEPVLNHAKKAKLYLHPDALDKKYSFTGGTSIFVGAAQGIKGIIESHSQTNKVVWTKEPTEIFPGLFVTGEVPRTNDFEIDENEFFLDEKAKKPDILVTYVVLAVVLFNSLAMSRSTLIIILASGYFVFLGSSVFYRYLQV